MVNPRALAGTLATTIAYQGARDLGRTAYRTARNMVFPRGRKYQYAYPSRGRYRRRYRYRRPRSSRYRRRYKKPRLYKRSRIGMPVNYGTTKRTLTFNAAAQAVDTRFLYSRDITFIAKTTTNDINQRQRDIINLRGFKIDYALRAQSAATRPVYVHMAVLAHASNTSVPSNLQDNCVDTENFFRGSGAARAINFNGTSLSGLQFNKLNINQDIYAVLRRWTVRLELRATQTTNIRNSSSQTDKSGKKYIPVRRQVRYDDPTTGDVATSGRMFLVWWAEYVTGIGAGSAGTTAAVNVDWHVVTYFREPSGC